MVSWLCVINIETFQNMKSCQTLLRLYPMCTCCCCFFFSFLSFFFRSLWATDTTHPLDGFCLTGLEGVSWEMSTVCWWELSLIICQRLNSYNVIWQHNYYQRFISGQQSEFVIFPSANYLKVTAKNTVVCKACLYDRWLS